MTLLVLASGQSNMNGAGTGGPLVSRIRRVKAWNNVNNGGADGTAWVTPSAGNPPLHVSGYNNLAIWFCHRLALETDQDVRLVMVSYGGKAISAWSPTAPGEMWSELVAVCTAAGIGPADIFLWHQGEQDAILGTSSASYQAQFVAMTDALEASGYLKPTAPRIVGGLCSHDDTMLQELAAANPLVSYAGKPDPAANQGDDVHFTGQALAYFGTELYWRQYAAHVGPRVLAGRLDSPL